jgi:glycosyltransferase involved in cell wall biosynthesis
MKILHLMLSNFYIDNYNYQENLLSRQNKLDGHDVLIIASTETYVDNINRGFQQPGTYINEAGIRVIRIPYFKIVNQFISNKLRVFSNVNKLITQFQPDIIFCHGIMTYEIRTIVNYRDRNPQVKLFLDSHEDFNNSATTFWSKNLLHRFYYKPLILCTLKPTDKILCVNFESILFLERLYKIPRDRLVLYPLGGVILAENIRAERRKKVRKSLGIADSDILIIHCGKMTKDKRTEEVVKAFCSVPNKNLRLILIGSLTKEVEETIVKYLKSDDRVLFLGWKNPEDLADFLIAGDLYVQPGSQSATMQNALCYGCVAALFPYESHKYLLKDVVFYIQNIKDMENLFSKIAEDKMILETKRSHSMEFARKTLDYKKLASYLYNSNIGITN